MLFMSYDTESNSRNADFISIAAERQSTTLGPKGRQTYEPSGPKGPVNLKNLFPMNPMNPHVRILHRMRKLAKVVP
jgi:hypothetical protein